MPLPSDNDLTFRTDDGARWGTGKAGPLTKAEVDLNFWSILLLIADLQSNTSLPREIQSITVASGKMTILMDDGVTTFGPFDLPEQAFNWTDAYVPAHVYSRLDVFTANDGAYLVVQDHTSASVFDPAASNMTGPLYKLMFPYQNIYDVGFFFPGKVGSGLASDDPMFSLRFARDVYLSVDLPGSVAGFEVNPTDFWSVDIYKNATLIGSYSWDPSASSGAEGFFDFVDDVQFHANDTIRVMRPAGDSASTLDPTARGFTMTIAARKGTI